MRLELQDKRERTTIKEIKIQLKKGIRKQSWTSKTHTSRVTSANLDYIIEEHPIKKIIDEFSKRLFQTYKPKMQAHIAALKEEMT